AAVIVGMHPGDDLHHGRLAGAVLADEPVDLAGLEREVDIPKGPDAAERLRDAAELQERGLSHRPCLCAFCHPSSLRGGEADEAIHASALAALDCFAALAMTVRSAPEPSLPLQAAVRSGSGPASTASRPRSPW